MRSPADEEHHLLSTCKVVDDRCSGGRRELTARIWSELCNFPGGARVGDDCRVMVNALSGHGGSTLEIRSWKPSCVREADELLYACSAASSACDGGLSAR